MKLAESDGFAQAEKPGAYARRTAIHLAITWRRRQASTPTVQQLTEPLAMATEPAPLDGLMRRETFEQLLDGLAEMSEGDQWLLSRRYLESCSCRRLAEELDCTPHQARALCHKAIGRLRQRLERHPAWVERDVRRQTR